MQTVVTEKWNYRLQEMMSAEERVECAIQATASIWKPLEQREVRFFHDGALGRWWAVRRQLPVS